MTQHLHFSLQPYLHPTLGESFLLYNSTGRATLKPIPSIVFYAPSVVVSYQRIPKGRPLQIRIQVFSEIFLLVTIMLHTLVVNFGV
jgi:hypothetical protein